MGFRFLFVAFIAALLPLPQKGALGHDAKIGSITIEHPWSRATPGGAAVAAGYLTIRNNGERPDRLVSVTTDIAGSAEVHEMKMADGVMQMRPLHDGVVVPAGGEVALKPGANHLMFVGLQRPLKEGESFAATLAFEKAGSVEVTFMVEKPGATAPAPAEHQGH
jgi:copper(I)-binding protein